MVWPIIATPTSLIISRKRLSPGKCRSQGWIPVCRAYRQYDEATTGDHRNIAAAGCDHRPHISEVTSPTPPVECLSTIGPSDAGFSSRERFLNLASPWSADTLRHCHIVEENGHREGGNRPSEIVLSRIPLIKKRISSSSAHDHHVFYE